MVVAPKFDPHSESAPPRFLADEMLGRLSRWLRILGYDAEWTSGAADSALVAWAGREGRILLTRDTLLVERRPIRRGEVRTVLIKGDLLPDQLRQLKTELGLRQRHEPRCLVCNATLESISREEAKSRVPPYVHQTQPSFRICPRCARVYWRGTHWRHMEKVLRQAGYDRPGSS